MFFTYFLVYFWFCSNKLPSFEGDLNFEIKLRKGRKIK